MFIQGGYFSADYTSIGNDPYGNYKQGQDTAQLGAVLTKELGQHELKFGFEGRLHQMNYIQTNAPQGIFNFTEHGSSGCPNDVSTCGGDAMASFMMGNAQGGDAEDITRFSFNRLRRTSSTPGSSRRTGRRRAL
jgi:hypothetical protein